VITRLLATPFLSGSKEVLNGLLSNNTRPRLYSGSRSQEASALHSHLLAALVLAIESGCYIDIVSKLHVSETESRVFRMGRGTARTFSSLLTFKQHSALTLCFQACVTD
jgi:hypothetical protein